MMSKDFVRFAKNGTEMRFTCKREGDRWEVRLLRNGQKNSMAVARIRKAGDIFTAPLGENVEMHIGMTALALLPQTAKDFKAWLEEAIEASKTEEEKAAEAQAARAAEVERLEGLLRRAGKQPQTPKTKKAAAELTKAFREFQREEYGEWGGWVRIISQEEVEELTARLAELRK